MSKEPPLNRALFGRHLAQARTFAGLTQREVAERTGVSLRTVQKWEAGERAPLRHLAELEEALGVDREALLRGTLEPPGGEMFPLTKRLRGLEEEVARLNRAVIARDARLADLDAAVADLQKRKAKGRRTKRA